MEPTKPEPQPCEAIKNEESTQHLDVDTDVLEATIRHLENAERESGEDLPIF